MRAHHSIQQEPTRETERDRAHSRTGLHGTNLSLRTLQHNACSDRETQGCGGLRCPTDIGYYGVLIMYEYRDPYIIDFSNLKTHWDIHRIIKEGLDFPDYYGCNWSAFWDCLTDMVGEKVHIEIVGLEVLRQSYADTADKMIEILQEFKHYCDDRFADDIKIEIVNGNTRTIIE